MKEARKLPTRAIKSARLELITNKRRGIPGWLIPILLLLCCHAVAQPARSPAARPSIVFLLLKITKDSTTGMDNLQVIEKIKSPGQIKKTAAAAAPGLTRLPYLSLRFCKGNTPLDSARYEYPLRERIQNTRENAQGYKDIEINSKEFFFRFQQGEADLLEIYRVGTRDKRKLLAIDLR